MSPNLEDKPIRPNATASSDASKSTIAFAFACLACFILMLGWILFSSYFDSLSRAKSRAGANAQIISANAALLIESSYQALRRIDSAVGDALTQEAKPDGPGDLGAAVSSLPLNVRAWVMDAEGRPRYTSTQLPKDFNVGDREYFQALKSGARFSISPLMTSRALGDKVFAVARRIERQGQFVGAAVLIIAGDFLDQFRRGLDLGPISTASLLREDGRLVTRSPLPEGEIDLKSYVLFENYLKQGDAGTYFGASPADGVLRIVGFQRVAGTPLIAIASVAVSEALAPFYQSAGTIAAFALPGLFGLGYFAVSALGAQKRLAAALEQNQTLFREIHHRVKNNLQQVLALVNMQPVPQAAKDEMARRVGAMVAVHEQMYRADRYGAIDASEFLPELLANIDASFANEIELSHRIDPIIIGRDQALPIALTLNEIVSNAIKHAFPHSETGRIEVEFTGVGPKQARLTVSDNGIGFDPAQQSSGMGNRLVRGLVRQLDGRVNYSFHDGTIVVVEFGLQAEHV